MSYPYLYWHISTSVYINPNFLSPTFKLLCLSSGFVIIIITTKYCPIQKRRWDLGSFASAKYPSNKNVYLMTFEDSETRWVIQWNRLCAFFRFWFFKCSLDFCKWNLVAVHSSELIGWIAYFSLPTVFFPSIEVTVWLRSTLGRVFDYHLARKGFLWIQSFGNMGSKEKAKKMYTIL